MSNMFYSDGFGSGRSRTVYFALKHAHLLSVPFLRRVVSLMSAFACCSISMAATLEVGPGKAYSTPSQAARHAVNGDLVLIAEGDYRGDVAVWRQDDLAIRGLGEGARLIAAGQSVEGKGTWVIKGHRVTVENIEFSGAKVRDRNGAGIRAEGTDLTIVRCRFFENENGILGGRGAGTIKIVDSEFGANGHGDGQSHNLYIGAIDRLEVTGSYFHHARVGHQLKSRARENYIAYNWLADGRDGNASYLIDLPEGGEARIIGNVLQQGPEAENYALLSFSAENKNAKSGELYIINNTFVNFRHAGLFVQIATPYATVHAQNNLFFGKGEVADRQIREVANVRIEKEGGLLRKRVFKDVAAFDFRLAEGSEAIDAGVDISVRGADGKIVETLVAENEPNAKGGKTLRRSSGPPDAGAFEFAAEN